MKKFLRHRFIVERLRMKPHSYEDLIRALEKSEEYCDVRQKLSLEEKVCIFAKK